MGGGMLLSLPQEILIIIFAYLPHETLLTLCLVNKQCKNLALDEDVWKQRCLRFLHPGVANATSSDLSLCGITSWIDVFKRWNAFPQQLLAYDTELPQNEVFLSTTSGTVVTTYISLPLQTGQKSLRLQAKFQKEPTTMEEKKEKIVNLLEKLPHEAVPEPSEYCYQYIDSSVIYYEIFVFPNDSQEDFTKRERTFPDALGIGMVSDTFKPHRNARVFPGWGYGSIGYHSDDGKLFLSTGIGSGTDEKWDAGDIVGCGYDTILQKFFFSLNGKLVASVDGSLITTVDGSWSAMITADANSRLVINLGQVPFLFSPYQYNGRHLGRHFTFDVGPLLLSDSDSSYSEDLPMLYDNDDSGGSEMDIDW